jgi:hypothetical protein
MSIGARTAARMPVQDPREEGAPATQVGSKRSDSGPALDRIDPILPQPVATTTTAIALYEPAAMLPLHVRPGVVVPSEALSFRAVRASGPGGQNVNKVSSKVELRVDVRAIEGLDDGARARLATACAGMLATWKTRARRCER